MSIFFDLFKSNSSVFNEIEAVNPNNDQPPAEEHSDAAQNQNDNQNNEVNDNPAEAPEDYTLPDQGEDQTPEEADNNPPEEGTQAGDQEDQNQDDGNDDNYDYADQDDNDGNDQNDDYTDDNNSYEDERSDDEVKQLEDELFSKFNSSQIAIMDRNLKINFNELFGILDELVDRINDIPKVMEYIKPIEFISNKLSDLRDMLADYLYYTYNTKTYVENKISYDRFMICANQIADLIGKIPSLRDSNH